MTVCQWSALGKDCSMASRSCLIFLYLPWFNLIGANLRSPMTSLYSQFGEREFDARTRIIAVSMEPLQILPSLGTQCPQYADRSAEMETVRFRSGM